MKSLAGAAGIAACCLLVSVPAAQGGELRLSTAELDRVTAAGPLFDLNPSFTSVGSQVSTGLLNPAPPPPIIPPVTPPVTPPAPPSNQVVISDGSASATIRIPDVPEGSNVNIAVNVFSDGGQSTAGVASQGSIIGGGNSTFTGGGHSSSAF